MPDKVQQEIEELLARLDHFPPRRSLRSRIRDALVSPFRAIRRLRGIAWPSISAGHVLLLAILAIVVAYLAGGESDVARWVIVGGILLFIAAFVFSLRRSGTGGHPPEKLWRGQPMDLRRPRGRSWWDRWRSRR
jgi:hypothetical protein